MYALYDSLCCWFVCNSSQAKFLLSNEGLPERMSDAISSFDTLKINYYYTLK